MNYLKQLPSKDYLDECVRLSKDGTLFWKARPMKHFKSQSQRFEWQKATGGEGCSTGDIVKIDGNLYLKGDVVYKLNTGLDRQGAKPSWYRRVLLWINNKL